MAFLLPMVTAFVIVFLLVPVIRHFALRFRFVDIPTKRKAHRQPIPLMGGLALYMGCMVPMLLFNGWTAQSFVILTGGTALFAIGLTDDWFKTKGWEFPVAPRILIYLLISTVPLWVGISIEGISHYAHNAMLFFPYWLSAVSTILWVFALINMVNFIDGADGLASGVVTISALTLFVIALIKHQRDPGVMAAILAGTCLAFLAYNFYPAKIFMGDAGALFLGYVLAITALDGAFKRATLLSLLVPVLAVGVPVLDTVIVFSRRLLRGQGLHHADRLHTHHALMKWGLSQTQTVVFLYLAAGLFSLGSIVLVLLSR
jgi:UDP-GlcNAc:undecaprenyl-phosphate GlcNAc-1-phosphate transferase